MWNITQEEGKTEPGKFRMKPVSLQYVMKETNKVGSSKRYFDLKTRSMINVNQLVFLGETTPGITDVRDILDPTILGQPGVMAVITASTSKTAKGNDQITELPDTINAGRNGAPPPPSYYAL